MVSEVQPQIPESPRKSEHSQQAVAAINNATAAQKLDDRVPKKSLLLLLCAVTLLEGADSVVLPAVFFALQRDLHLSLNALATMTLAQALCQSAAAPFWGVLADRGILSRKRILVLGCMGQGIVTMVLSSVDAFLPMVLLRALNGAFLASLRPVACGVLADVTGEAGRGRVYGWIFFALNIGTMLGSLFATPISTKTIGVLQGWRVAFLGIGAFACLVGCGVMFFMVEPKREGEKLNSQKGVCSELQRLLGYFRMPTFVCLVIQGCFGCVPWNAMGYRTLFFQVGGIGDTEAAIIGAMAQASAAMGGLYGGKLADYVVKHCFPIHGRPLIAQISVFAGIPIACLTFMVAPPAVGAFWYYLFLVVLLGLTATWCATGVNLPILSQIVPADNRSAVMAWETALEGSCAAVFGNAMVGILAQNLFGYDLSNSGSTNSHNVAALGNALALTVAFPWVICLAAYSLLHWAYPRDLRRVRLLAKAAQDEKDEKEEKDEQDEKDEDEGKEASKTPRTPAATPTAPRTPRTPSARVVNASASQGESSPAFGA